MFSTSSMILTSIHPTYKFSESVLQYFLFLVLFNDITFFLYGIFFTTFLSFSCQKLFTILIKRYWHWIRYMLWRKQDIRSLRQPNFCIYIQVYIFCKLLWWGVWEEGQTGKINGSREKNKTKERRTPPPPKKIPPFGCKIDFSWRGGEIIWFTCIIYTPV